MSSNSQTHPNEKEEEEEEYVILKIINAKLSKNVELFGKMDPYAVVDWVVSPSSSKEQIARTHTAWDAHMTPAWDYTCVAHLYKGYGKEESVEISVYEDDGPCGKADFCGKAVASIDSLLGQHEEEEEVNGTMEVITENGFGPTKTLGLMFQGEIVGTVQLQVRKVSRARATTAPTPTITPGIVTTVDPDMFVTPVKRLGVSGGTAPFFLLQLKNPPSNHHHHQFSIYHYIGKDLSRSEDEAAFYEQILKLQQEEPKGRCQGLSMLLDYTFEYRGVLTAFEEGTSLLKTQTPVKMMVLQNLRRNCTNLRLLDLKIGEKTAQGGWQGKTHLQAFRQSLLDKFTNSSCEGYRLEGFDGRPETMRSMDPSIHVCAGNKNKAVKKMRRMMFQALSGNDIFMHFADLRHLDVMVMINHHNHNHNQSNLSCVDTSQFWSRIELSEIIMHEIVSRLVRLAVICHNVSIPQKWIGSSVALGFDAVQQLPKHSEKTEKDIRSNVFVNIFDWGRSELNTLENDQKLDFNMQHDRRKYWAYYKAGIDELSRNAALSYLHQFGNSGQWSHITFKVFDFDTATQDDFIGKVTVLIELTELKTCFLLENNAGSSISYSISWCCAPQSSRIKGAWRVFISSAKNIPIKDIATRASNPYCIMEAKSKDGTFELKQMTTVKHTTLNPVWNETFYVPIARSEDAMKDALSSSSSGVDLGCEKENLFEVLKKENWTNEVRNAVIR